MLKKKKILLTAGPTYESIDPVRFIGNRSSGKMGISIAEILLKEGCEVILVLGPVSIEVQAHESLKVVSVESAEQMYEACANYFDWYDIGIFAAAVADYTPKIKSDIKIKKAEDSFLLELIKTKDILGEAGKRKKTNQVLVGFALETNNEKENAMLKLEKKNLDIIVLNSLNDSGAGFKHSTNKITILDKTGKITIFDLKSKDKVAEDIIDYLKTYSA